MAGYWTVLIVNAGIFRTPKRAEVRNLPRNGGKPASALAAAIYLQRASASGERVEVQGEVDAMVALLSFVAIANLGLGYLLAVIFARCEEPAPAAIVQPIRRSPLTVLPQQPAHVEAAADSSLDPDPTIAPMSVTHDPPLTDIDMDSMESDANDLAAHAT